MADLLADLVGAIGRYDEAVIRDRDEDRRYWRERGPADDWDALERDREAARAQLRRATQALRTAQGLYLAAVHDTPLLRARWRELCAISPGLRADDLALDERRRSR